MSTQQSRQDVSGIGYYLGDDVLWDRNGYIWTGRIESTPSSHEDDLYTIMFAGTDVAEVEDSDIIGCAAGFWCDECGGTMHMTDSEKHDLGFSQWFECAECDATGKRYTEPDSNIDRRYKSLQETRAVLEGKPVDEIPMRSKPGDGQ